MLTKRVILGTHPLWTPLKLGASLSAWWDAQYLPGLTLTGSAATVWTDRKSGIPVTGTATWSASARNGKPGLSFNGTTDFFASGASPPVPSTATAFTIAVSGFASTANFGVFVSYEGSETDQTHLRELGQDGAYFGNNGSFPSTSTWNGVDKFVVGIADGVSLLSLYDNGGTPATAAYTPIIGTSTLPILFGARNGNALSSSAIIVSQVLIIDGVLTTVQRQLLEGWESWYTGKFGSNLSLTHPYRFRPPT